MWRDRDGGVGGEARRSPTQELVQDQEELLPTQHEKVLMVRNHQFDAEGFRQDLERLRCLMAVPDGRSGSGGGRAAAQGDGGALLGRPPSF
jgi:hypothetical protein